MAKKADTQLLWYLIGIALAAIIVYILVTGVFKKIFDVLIASLQ